MSTERFIQDKLFDERSLPPKQESEHYYAWSIYEGLDQPNKDVVPEDYYIHQELTKLNIQRSQFRYVNDNFAVVEIGNEIAVLSRTEMRKWYNLPLGDNSHKNTDKIFINEKVWIENERVIINPDRLKKLEVLHGKKLEKASRDEIGGKSLGELELKKYEHFGYKVPEFIVVPTSFCNILQTHGFEGRAENIMKQFSSASDIAKKEGIDAENVAGFVPRKIENMFDSLDYYESIFRPFILPEIVKICADNGENKFETIYGFELIVRSSSPLEDGEENLFQGVFQSRRAEFWFDRENHYVSSEKLYEAFKNVILSPWTAYPESYLRNRGLVGKVSRSMAEIIQVVPDDIEFVGRAYFDSNNGTEVEYLDRWVDSGDYVGNKIFVDEGVVTKRVDDVEDYGLREIGDHGTLLSDERAIKISKIMEKLSVVFPKYNGQFNIEFGIDKNGIIYLFQIRPTKRVPVGGIIPDFNQIDRNKILFECSEYNSPFSIGKIVGPVANFLDIKYDCHKMPPQEYLNKVLEYDKTHPGSIFIVHLNIPSIRDFNMLTPNKKGIIVCYIHDQFTRNDHAVEELYRDPTFHIANVLPQTFQNLKTGTRIGIVSNGEKAVFYEPGDDEPDISIFNPQTIFRPAWSFSNDEYVQGKLFNSRNLKKR